MNKMDEWEALLETTLAQLSLEDRNNFDKAIEMVEFTNKINQIINSQEIQEIQDLQET